MSLQLRDAAEESPATISRSVRDLMKPLIRMIIKVINYNQFCEIAKQVYVAEARCIIRNRGDGKVTKSEISLMTGIDARQFPEGKGISSKEGINTAGESEEINPNVQLLGSWAKHCVDSKDKCPTTIRVTGSGFSFERLVSKFYPRGVTYKQALEYLIACGNIRFIAEDTVELVDSTYIPISNDYNNLLDVGLHSTKYLLGTVEENLRCDDASRRKFQRDYRTLIIDKNEIGPLKKELDALLNSAYFEIAKLIESRETADEETNSSAQYVGVGMFMFEGNSKQKETTP